ncbi:MAG: hypothetical protein JNK67_11410 [Alphaproteobacteria bacterium]|nr:hypothetical protein [Alphaproteobacteria bacterium]
MSATRTGRRALWAWLLVAGLGGLLAACGRRGKPEAPEDVDPAYPRRYPSR